MESLEEKVARLEKINELQEARIHNYELMVDNYIEMVQKMEDVIYSYEYNIASLESLFLSCFDDSTALFKAFDIRRNEGSIFLYIDEDEGEIYIPLIPNMFDEIADGESKSVDELKKEYSK